jgi:hypothetical protein
MAMTTYNHVSPQAEHWIDLPVQVKEDAAETITAKREIYTPDDRIELSAGDLGVPESVKQALNFEAYIWPLPRVSDEAFCLVDFSGRSVKPFNTRVYYYPTRVEAVALASRHVKSAYEAAVAKQERKALIAKKDAESLDDIELGDVLFSSWGYDQTNVDFYECTGFKGKTTLVLRKIAGDSSDTGGSMGGKTTPCVGQYVSGEFTRRWNNGSVTIDSSSRARPLEYTVVAGAKVYKAQYCSSYH